MVEPKSRSLGSNDFVELSYTLWTVDIFYVKKIIKLCILECYSHICYLEAKIINR